MLEGSFVVEPLKYCRKYYKIEGTSVEPLKYLNFPTPLARGAVRLGVFRLLESETDGLAETVYSTTKEISQVFHKGNFFL